MVFELKRFGTIGGMGKGNLSFQLFSYRTKNESIDDLLTTGYFKDLQGAVAINDIILILNLEEKDDYKQVEFLVVKDLDIKLGITVERLKSSYLPAEILPLVSSNNGAIGVSVNFARADHSHPKAISSETERGEIIIATQEEVNEGIEDTKAITSLKNKTYFNNSFDNRQATDEEIEEGTDIKKYLNPKQIKDIKDEIYNNVDILDNNIIALNNDVVNLNNNKANIDLNNLSTAGQAIIDNKANVDLNNLSSTGQTYIKSLVDENVLNRDIDNLTATGISNLQNYLYKTI